MAHEAIETERKKERERERMQRKLLGKNRPTNGHGARRCALSSEHFRCRKGGVSATADAVGSGVPAGLHRRGRGARKSDIRPRDDDLFPIDYHLITSM